MGISILALEKPLSINQAGTCRKRPGSVNECLSCRPFVQRYMILVANGRGAYHPIDVESMDQVQAGEYVRKILQAARVDGWQV